MLDTLLAKVFGTQNARDLKRVQPTVAAINEREATIRALSDDDLQAKTAEFREQVERGTSVDDLLIEAFAVVREAGRRVLDMRHFDVQLIGGMMLHRGQIAEMKTGEGKTLVATLAAYLNALEGKGVHVVTVNDYLARRDSDWMGRVYRFLGMSVGVVQHDLRDPERHAAYRCDITYGTNNEFGFDYLRDNMKFEVVAVRAARSPLRDRRRGGQHSHRRSAHAPHHLRTGRAVDRALLRGRPHHPAAEPGAVTQGNVKAEDREALESTGDFLVDEKHKTVTLTETGMAKVRRSCSPGRLSPGRPLRPGQHAAAAPRQPGAPRPRSSSATWTTW